MPFFISLHAKNLLDTGKYKELKALPVDELLGHWSGKDLLLYEYKQSIGATNEWAAINDPVVSLSGGETDGETDGKILCRESIKDNYLLFVELSQLKEQLQKIRSSMLPHDPDSPPLMPKVMPPTVKEALEYGDPLAGDQLYLVQKGAASCGLFAPDRAAASPAPLPVSPAPQLAGNKRARGGVDY